jgi:hypothetical protein
MSPASDPPFPPEAPASGAPSDGSNSAGMLPVRRPRAALPAALPPGVSGVSGPSSVSGPQASDDGYSYGPGTVTWQPPAGATASGGGPGADGAGAGAGFGGGVYQGPTGGYAGSQGRGRHRSGGSQDGADGQGPGSWFRPSGEQGYGTPGYGAPGYGGAGYGDPNAQQPRFGGPDYRDPAAGYHDPGHAGPGYGPGYGPGGGYQAQAPGNPQTAYQGSGYQPDGFFAGGVPAGGPQVGGPVVGGPPAGGYDGSGYQPDHDGFRPDRYPQPGGLAGHEQPGGYPGQQPGGFGYPGQGPGGYPNAQPPGFGGQVPPGAPASAPPLAGHGAGYPGQLAQPPFPNGYPGNGHPGNGHPGGTFPPAQPGAVPPPQGGQFPPPQPGAFGNAPPGFFGPAQPGFQQAPPTQPGFQQGQPAGFQPPQPLGFQPPQPGGFAPGLQQGSFAAAPPGSTPATLPGNAPAGLPGSFPGQQPGGYPNQPTAGFPGQQLEPLSRFRPGQFGQSQSALPAVAATVADGTAVKKNGKPGGKTKTRMLIGGSAVVAVLAVGGVIVGPKLLEGSTDPGCTAYRGTALSAYNQAIGDLNARATQPKLTSDMPPAINDLTAAADQAKSTSVKSALDGLVAELKTVSTDVDRGSVPSSTVQALNNAANAADHAC